LPHDFAGKEVTLALTLTARIPDPAGLVQSDPVLGFSGWRLHSSHVVDERFVDVGVEQRRQLGVKGPAVVDGREPAEPPRPTHDEAGVVVRQSDDVTALARLAAADAPGTCWSRDHVSNFITASSITHRCEYFSINFEVLWIFVPIRTVIARTCMLQTDQRTDNRSAGNA